MVCLFVSFITFNKLNWEGPSESATLREFFTRHKNGKITGKLLQIDFDNCRQAIPLGISCVGFVVINVAVYRYIRPTPNQPSK